MHVKIKVYEVTATGDAEVVREALAPVLEAMGVTLGASMPEKTVAFLAAHGFTVEDYRRGMREREDVEAFVARRELEQAGMKFTRTVPGDIWRAGVGREPESQAAETSYLAARLGRSREDWRARTDEERDRYVASVRGLRPHPDLAPVIGDPPVVVPDLKGQDPQAVRDRMNALPRHPAGPAKPTGCGLFPTSKPKARKASPRGRKAARS